MGSPCSTSAGSCVPPRTPTGGFIGLEVACAARKHDLAVDLVEMQPRVMSRAVGQTVSRYALEAHRAIGINVYLGVRVTSAGGADNAAQLADDSAALVTERIRSMMEDRRRRPGDDLFSVMLKAQSDGAEISDPEILSIVAHLLQAGTQTTRILLTNGLMTLLQHPDELARVRADRDLVKPAVEECLRWITPARTLAQRVTVGDLEVGGTVIPEGDEPTVWVGAANRDPKVFENPDTFDVSRSPNPHLAFSTGTHYCLGVNLAKLEGSVVFRMLLDELPDLEFSESELVWGDSPMRPLITSMPVRVRRAA